MHHLNKPCAAVWAISALFCLASCPGCGGGSSSSGGRTGSMHFTIDWPEPSRESSRLIPKATKSIKFVVFDDRADSNDPPVRLAEKVVVRPSSASSSTVELIGLPAVPVRVEISGQPMADGSGTAQATGSVRADIKESKTAEASVTLASTITEVRLGAPVITRAGSLRTGSKRSPLPLEEGQKAIIEANGYDASGRLVLTDPSKWNWTSSNSNSTVASAGQTGTITAVKEGVSAVTAAEAESTKSAQVDLAIAKPTGGGPIIGDPAMYGTYVVNFVVTYGPGEPYTLRGVSRYTLTLSRDSSGGTLLEDDVDGVHYLTLVDPPIPVSLTSPRSFKGQTGRTTFEGTYIPGKLIITGHGDTNAGEGNFQYYELTYTCSGPS
jgi:hypothetical protein